MHVLENSYHSEDGGWIDTLAEGLVIETDIAARDGDLEFFASPGKSINGLRELPHDMWLFGISEVQTIGRSNWNCPRTSYFSSSLSDGMHRAEPGIEVAPA